jgi:hypothetical protein
MSLALEVGYILASIALVIRFSADFQGLKPEVKKNFLELRQIL